MPATTVEPPLSSPMPSVPVGPSAWLSLLPKIAVALAVLGCAATVSSRERVRRALFPPFCHSVRSRFSRLTKRLIDVHQSSSISPSVCMHLIACPCTVVHTRHITICLASARICSSLSEHLCAHECWACRPPVTTRANTNIRAAPRKCWAGLSVRDAPGPAAAASVNARSASSVSAHLIPSPCCSLGCCAAPSDRRTPSMRLSRKRKKKGRPRSTDTVSRAGTLLPIFMH